MDPLTLDQNQAQPQDQLQPLAPPVQASATSDQQQVVDKLRASKSVLITVGSSPSVDELASALGLSVVLSKLDKHVTTVFSGKIPPAIEFLDPEAVFEDSVDSLRDFIIALSKDKADKLRYKVEDDVVKVFITPYKTVLSEKDLAFSQGDLNVDVVVALGVANEDDLDAALVAHGKVLHSATIVTLTAGEQMSKLGVANWSEPEASSIAEMLVALSSQLGPDLLDEQSSTALLTGIVAETNRFSNDKTTPKVMTISAQLMAAGANQQLVASNLRQEGMITEPIRAKAADKDAQADDGEVVLEHGAAKEKVKKSTNNIVTEKVVKPVIKPLAPAEIDETPQIDGPSLENTPTDQSSQSDDLASVSSDALPTLEPLDPDGQDPVGSMAAPSVADPLVPAEGSINSQDDVNSQTPVETAAADVDAARNAVEAAGAPEPPKVPSPADVPEPVALPAIDGGSTSPVDPSQPLAFTAPPLGSLGSADTSSAAEVKDEPAPMDAFMQTHDDTSSGAPDLNALTNQSVDQPAAAMPPDLPPLPPMPAMSDQSGLPPMPPIPGEASVDPVAGFQPAINPGFMQDMPQSQNAWTAAGDDLSAKQADKAADRQAKMDKMNDQYDRAVDRNRELNGLPPLNDPNGSGLPPVPPAQGL